MLLVLLLILTSTISPMYSQQLPRFLQPQLPLLNHPSYSHSFPSGQMIFFNYRTNHNPQPVNYRRPHNSFSPSEISPGNFSNIPTAESLFTPALKETFPAESSKQYENYIKALEETSKEVTTTESSSTLMNYVNVNFNHNNQQYSYSY